MRAAGQDNGDNFFSDEDEQSIEDMKRTRQLPFDQGASSVVPTDMQPANQWVMLKETYLFDWPFLPLKEYLLNLGKVYLFFTVFISLPIAGGTFEQPDELAQRLLSANAGGTAVVLALVIRLWLGVGHVSERLKADAVYFESDEKNPTTTNDLERLGYRSRSGNWVKSPEIAARDRLVRQFEVVPCEDLLRKTLGGLASVFVVSVALASSLQGDASYDPRFMQSEARLQQLNMPSYDGLANQEGQRLRERSNKPAYCYSRYYKAVAGGDSSVCD